MLRTIAARNELVILRGTALARARSAREAVRVMGAQTARKLQTLRLGPKNHVANVTKPLGMWSTNFARNYADLPSHIKVPLPALSPTMEQGTIISWEKKEGDKLNEGDLLAEIETDKATMGFETPEEGYLAKIVVQAGTKDVAIGKLVCIIVQNQEDVAAFKDFVDSAPAAAKPAAAAPPPAAAAPVAPPPPPPAAAPAPVAAAPVGGKPMTAVEQRGERVYASPMAKKLAEAQSLRLQGAGSGIYGSIKSSDLAGMAAAAPAVGAHAAPAAPQGGYIDIPVSNVRGVIAKRLKESKQQIPHYYVTMECQMDNLLKLREKVNKKYEKQGVRVSVNDFIIKATATACRKVPESNSYWMESVIRQFDNVDVSMAVSTDTGLITPIVFGADRKGVIDISKDTKSLAAKARENKLKPQEFQGGTVCVSNLGMMGVSQFAAVINPPQSCILAIGATTKKLILDPDSLKGFREVSVMNVTLSADHRTVDGAVAAKWLQYFRDFIEDPQTMIL
ncbi:dihydrolipoyllysine-residue acetyltransferase component of pyruvate dehydrogenase complex, mitochondrial [Bactrocera neohumeralis]|uniref:dihydrolipoyllysine-residue acetyltransferase component of pyruvate dehydrogenase complex, mitochondrial n=1 Tax=Bactrocera neohumeralis TaxID=98809 RepID=UPI0021651C61|nr:dihydrolipoyllysine-residue acetyltransferase component of pyruvate dehydrogenase complex, mitochondrial [Bactrocera neohumeralis]XP_050321078.1 dihydrolipoyllysine-residue acetyltransferase component of pyruvate dehydrogenase complex, mitochondrial [Bactrocera neohumeralis]XP_050321079.1 dihydrolipoyllysine-residue acetyltransferase component of pyruvate dehydrogenase complex, mitochondrial [Bactrocera neohumeralis]XP_050321080.1 dihydrolipoyllysine-residue acetyltransferase component of pyr